MLYLIAAWAVVTGILEIVTAIDLRKVIENDWLLGLSGLASVVFGVIVGCPCLGHRRFDRVGGRTQT